MTLTNEYLTTAQAARKLRLSQQHTIRLARLGTLPVLWTPLGRLYAVDDVERLALEREQRLIAA